MRRQTTQRQSMERQISIIQTSHLDERRVDIYQKLKGLQKVSPQIRCPSSKVVTQMCTNPSCKISLRCSNIKCIPCGKQTHKQCVSVDLKQVTELLNKKLQSWTQILVNIFMREEKLIESIRQSQDQFARKFIELKIEENRLEEAMKIYEERDYQALNGERAGELLKELQRQLFFDKDDIDRSTNYKGGLEEHIRQINQLRDRCFMEKEVLKPGELERLTPEEKIKKQEKEELKLKKKIHDSFFNKGQGHMQANRHEQAITCFKIAAELKSDEANTFYKLGQVLNQVNKHKEAMESLQKAIWLSPKHAYAHQKMGNLHFNRKQYQSALKSYKQAVDIKPENQALYVNLGNTLIKLKRYHEAAAHFHKAIKLKPDLEKPYKDLKRLLINRKDTTQIRISVSFLENDILLANPNNQHADAARNQLKSVCAGAQN